MTSTQFACAWEENLQQFRLVIGDSYWLLSPAELAAVVQRGEKFIQHTIESPAVPNAFILDAGKTSDGGPWIRAVAIPCLDPQSAGVYVRMIHYMRIVHAVWRLAHN